MSRRQAAEAIAKATKVAQEKAAQELIIKKISDFKARKGYKIVQVKYIPGVARTLEPNQRILGRGYFWSETGEKELCYALEVPANVAAPIKKDFERAKAENRRKYRHRIWNKKHTKLIMCPFTNSCSKCPFADHPEDIFPSEAEEHQEFSYDVINEEKVPVAPGAYGSAESIDHSLEMEQMLQAIKALNDQLFYNFAVLFSQGCEYEDMMEELGIDFDGIKTCYFRYIEYKNEYLD